MLKNSVVLVGLLSSTIVCAGELHVYESREQSETLKKGELAAAFSLKAAMTGLRGTHSKGTCVNGTLTVKDLQQAGADLPASIAKELRVGFFAKPGTYPSRIRFANADGSIGDDHAYDARAVSISANLGKGRRQDFVLQNSPVFPVPNLADFVLLVQFASNKAKKDISRYTPDEQARLRYMLATAKTFTPDVKSYRTETYWSETAYALGKDGVAKYIMVPCATNASNPVPSGSTSSSADNGANYLQADLAAGLAAEGDNCFDFRVQIFRPDRMTLNGKKIPASDWVENPTLPWNPDEAPSYSVAELRLGKGVPQAEAECNAFKRRVDVNGNTDRENAPIGRINRARKAPEIGSAVVRAFRSIFRKPEPAIAVPNAPAADDQVTRAN